MPFVRGFLGRWHPGAKPGQPLPPAEGGPPDWGIEEGGGEGGNGDLDFWGGERPPPSRPDRPELPPREEWPPLPPWFDEHPSHMPIPPRPGAPTVPLPPDPEIDELPEIWPPLPQLPGIPDLGGKTLALVVVHVSRRVHFVRWMVIDHEEAKSKLQKALAWLKAHLPAGGVGGRPPPRPGP